MHVVISRPRQDQAHHGTARCSEEGEDYAQIGHDQRNAKAGAQQEDLMSDIRTDIISQSVRDKSQFSTSLQTYITTLRCNKTSKPQHNYSTIQYSAVQYRTVATLVTSLMPLPYHTTIPYHTVKMAYLREWCRSHKSSSESNPRHSPSIELRPGCTSSG